MTPLALVVAATPKLFGLSIGYNGSDTTDVAPLRYADDDAVKNAELLRDLGARHVLLTELDPDSSRLFGDVDAARPTRRAVDAALDELETLIATEKARGRRTELLIFYSGHGDVENNRGYVALAGGRLYRDDFRDLITRTSADAVHVIVDACKSYFLVFERGPGGERSRVALELEPALLPEHVGLFLSTSSAQDSHEWEAFQSGVFSHEVRSALRGGADLDRDGAISYEEAAAFVFGANRAIPNARYRPRFFSKPPKATTLLDLRGRGGPRLTVELAAHFFVEDARGNRLLDLHPATTRAVDLLIPASRPLFVREVGRPVEYVGESDGPIVLAKLEARPAAASARGAEHVAFTRLFTLPFDGAALAAYRDDLSQAATLMAEASPEWPRPFVGALGLGLAIAGGVMTGLALEAKGDAGPDTAHVDRTRINDRIEGYNLAAILLYAAGGALGATFLVWTLWPEEDPNITVIADGRGVRMLF